MRTIEIALANYRAVNGRFPPAVVYDKNGAAMHSWRVLILPYLEAKDLYDQYDFSEPWNGRKNRTLADRMPQIYRCPAASRRTTMTSYVAVVGPGTAWSDSPDNQGPSDVEGKIMLAEVAKSGINWMEPGDLAIDDALKGVDRAGAAGISSLHPDGANVVFSGGWAEILPSSIEPGEFKRILARHPYSPRTP